VSEPLSPKAHYQKLRHLSWAALWDGEVVAFDEASGPERMKRVAVVRAVGVVAFESGSTAEKEMARQWLRGLLRDPQEKIRRYAMTALPKLGADAGEEGVLLGLLERPASEREAMAVGRALEKIGGAATLERAGGALSPSARTLQKAQANVARSSQASEVCLDALLEVPPAVRLNLRCRRGLERILEMEVAGQPKGKFSFRLGPIQPGCGPIEPTASFHLRELFALRCFSQVGFVLGSCPASAGGFEELAGIIASSSSWRILESLTRGPVRYRLEFVGQGHRRSAVREVTDRVFALRPTLINDSRMAPWQIDVRSGAGRYQVELTPRLQPDPRFAYRCGDVPAASHPPLAASLARLAGVMRNEVVWDPFCGSGLELIECALRGGVERLIGTDLSAEAIRSAEKNIASALGSRVPSRLVCADFRDFAKLPELRKGSVSLVISNPPMGRRVPVADLEEMMDRLMVAARQVLRPGGRLIFTHPLPGLRVPQGFRREFQQKVDLGGFEVRVEKYLRS